ncbi:MotA/TolQ/ExbB proton channel family protein [Pandoraea anhela]|uniref:MotA/TolQ/ExbB proton channel n=1 Tax=Pandoraea anhela TaxID=2508295 RepID=A0A5E4Z800_9BURK|nr:MotA/TolQ/ExbB proton channel family protein [Pandoraea anhela]VVE56812.1 MotA/TolQ/ExbB proton channel [Pandoraea anhela]
MSFVEMNRLALASGGTLYLMVVLAFVGITVIVDRGIRLLRTHAKSERMLRQIEAMSSIDARQAEQLGEAANGLPMQEVLLAYAASRSRPGVTDLDNALEEAIYRMVPGIDRGVWVLETVITVAPLLGLFGTIVGMFHAFDVLGAPGENAMNVTSGVAEALIATAAGLAIAMSHLWFYNAMQETVRKSVHQLETLKRVLMNRQDTHVAVAHASDLTLHRSQLRI